MCQASRASARWRRWVVWMRLAGGVDSLLAGLLHHKGLPACAAYAPQLEFDSALSFGDVFALDQIWSDLGFDALAGVFRKARFTTAVEHALRIMVLHRLCDADSKLGLLRWQQTVYIVGPAKSRQPAWVLGFWPAFCQRFPLDFDWVGVDF